MVGRPTHGLFHGFFTCFWNDGFLPMVFCRFGQGNYDYVLIQVCRFEFMNALACIYMYCKIKRNIMKNQTGCNTILPHLPK